MPGRTSSTRSMASDDQCAIDDATAGMFVDRFHRFEVGTGWREATATVSRKMTDVDGRQANDCAGTHALTVFG